MGLVGDSPRVHNSEFEERLTSPAPKARAGRIWNQIKFGGPLQIGIFKTLTKHSTFDLLVSVFPRLRSSIASLVIEVIPLDKYLALSGSGTMKLP